MSNLKQIFESIVGTQKIISGSVYYGFRDRDVLVASKGRLWSILYMENFLYRGNDEEYSVFDENKTKIVPGILYIRKNLSLESGIIHNDQTEFCVFEDQNELWYTWPGRLDPFLLQDWVKNPSLINKMFIEDAKTMLNLNKQL